MSLLEIKAGTVVEPDGWSGLSNALTACEWEGASFRLEGRHSASAVNVTVSGRKVRWHEDAPAVRVRIEWVREGEPSDFSHGWAWL